MGLTPGKLAAHTVTIDGAEVEYHELSYADAIGLDAYQERKAEAPAYIIEKATGADADTVAAFLSTHRMEDGVTLVNAILEASGIATFRARVSDGD